MSTATAIAPLHKVSTQWNNAAALWEVVTANLPSEQVAECDQMLANGFPVESIIALGQMPVGVQMALGSALRWRQGQLRKESLV